MYFCYIKDVPKRKKIQRIEILKENCLCNRSDTRKSVSSDFQTRRSRLEKRGAAEFFGN